MSDKLFDCVFIASDSKNVKKVRFANDYAKRLNVLKRDKFTIHYDFDLTRLFDRKLTKQEIIDFLYSTEAKVDVNDEDAIDNAQATINKAKTKVTDVFAAILSRKTENTETQSV